jgi:hypothetical protein
MRLQKLGFEIRKIGNLDNLYKDVDSVLSNHQINTGEINISVQVNAVAHSLQKMIAHNNYFDICTVRNCAELCGLIIPADRMKVYQTQHCIHWSEMTTDFRQILVAMILDDFRSVFSIS